MKKALKSMTGFILIYGLIVLTVNLIDVYAPYVELTQPYMFLVLPLDITLAVYVLVLYVRVINAKKELTQEEANYEELEARYLEACNIIQAKDREISRLEKEYSQQVELIDQYEKEFKRVETTITANEWQPCEGDIVKVKYGSGFKEQPIKEIIINGSNLLYYVAKCGNKKFTKEQMELIELKE